MTSAPVNAMRVLAVLLALVTAAGGQDPGDGSPVIVGSEFFETRIRPILIEHCYECHSAESEQVQGGLRLDYREGLLAGGDSGPAIVPGEPGDSLLVSALRYEDYEMPPDGKLPENVVHDFERWISEGADDPREEPSRSVPDGSAQGTRDAEPLWSVQPLETTPLPSIHNRSWSTHEIDHYVLAALEEAGLQPAPEADRFTLLRRLSFDLTGLPPTPEALMAFAADDDPLAWERVVDGLLASPHFGEHWGRMWLDVVRYSDSNGGDFNATYHHAWRYRDYVYASFNRDKPYTDFVREQLAGDLLPFDGLEDRREQLVATTFWMLGAKMLSERDKEKLTLDIADEQLDTLGRAFLGMTLGCARCHDHKFDPIETREYYALAGILTSTVTVDGEFQQYVSRWNEIDLPVPEEQAALRQAYLAELEALQAQLEEAEEALQLAQRNRAWNRELARGVVVDDVEAEMTGEWKSSTYSPNFVGSGYLHDDNDGKGEKTIRFSAELPADGRYEVRIAYNAGNGRARTVPVVVHHAEGMASIVVDQSKAPPVAGLLLPLGEFVFRAGESAVVEIGNADTARHVIADAVQWIPVDGADATADATEEPDEATPDESKPQAQVIAEAEARIAELQQQVESLEADAPPPAPRAMIVREATDPIDEPLRIRGEVQQRGDQVPRGFPSALAPLPTAVREVGESGRRELADWVTNPAHPLPPRVAVNRAWARLMGHGLVRSVDTFGRLGDRPSHPDLLDALALKFQNDGGSWKTLVRDIVLSRAYRMSTQWNAEGHERDPANRLLWRAHRKPVTAESLRDAMLRAGGELDLRPTIEPVGFLGRMAVQNDGNQEGGGFDYDQNHCRGVYLPVIRNELPDILLAFDFPDPEMVQGTRPQTSVPAQALYLMNSPFVAERARNTAAQVLLWQVRDEDERLDRLYLQLLARLPRPLERERAQRLLFGELSVEERAERWRDYVHVLFATTEFRFLD